jgi:rubredoxin
MIQSAWKCPQCKQSLFVTNSARYWCSQCQTEQDAAHVDPMNRDYARLSVEFDAAIERGLGVSFERAT